MQSRRDEYNFDPTPQESRVPPEYGLPPEYYPAGAEDPMPCEDTIPAEFNDRPTGRRSEKSGDSQRHTRIKRLFLLPVASVLAAVSIVCAAFETDPLGSDFLMQSGGGSSPSQTIPPDVSGDLPVKPTPTDRREPVTEPELDGEVTRYYHVTYQPTGDAYHNEELTDESAYEDMINWVRGVGGDADEMVLYDYKVTSAGQRLSDDAVYIGDEDDLGNAIFISGGLIELYRLDLYYEAYPVSQDEPPVEPTPNAITSVEVTDAALVYNVGDTPKNTASVPDGARYAITDEIWAELDENGHVAAVNHFHSYFGMTPVREDFQFEEGKTYRYYVALDVVDSDDSSAFAQECAAAINGSPFSGFIAGTEKRLLIEGPTMTPTNSAEPQYTDSFPSLPNLNPDFAGEYAWAGMGSEEYVALGKTFLHAGTYYTSQGVEAQDVPGVSYDRTTNTLTLDNYSGDDVLDVNLMGNGFTIRLIGENHLSQVMVWGAMYGGSLTLTGDGSLTLNESGTAGAGLVLQAEQSESCLMIDRQVTLEVFGDPAILITSTQMEKAIYALEPITVTGGTPLGAPDGSEVPLYDYSVVDEDGNLSRHVIFSPKE